MKLNELKTSTVQSYLDKTVDPVYGIPKSKEKLAQRTKGIERANKRLNKPANEASKSGRKKPDFNFDADDIKRLEHIRDLETLKTQAMELISRPSLKPMKPEKVQWFKSALADMNSPLKIIKLMYDLLLSGEGHGVIGSRHSMSPNSYRRKFDEKSVEEGLKDPKDNPCWKGYHPVGTKKKGGRTVPNCVPNANEAANPAQQAAIAISMKKAGKKPKNESLRDGEYHTWTVHFDDGTSQQINVGNDEFDAESYFAKRGKNVVKVDYDFAVHGERYGHHPRDTQGDHQERLDRDARAHRHHDRRMTEDWQKVNKSDKTDGMSKKAVNAYRRENPGSKLKTAVTTKPSKLKKGSKSAKRRKSFCARMSGMKKAHASAKTKRNPDSPINKALRRWNCESIEHLENQLLEITLNENKRSNFE